MSNELSPDHAKFLESALATGKYQNESDALNQAVSLLQRRDQLEAELDAARKQLEEGQGIPAEEAFARFPTHTSPTRYMSSSTSSMK